MQFITPAFIFVSKFSRGHMHVEISVSFHESVQEMKKSFIWIWKHFVLLLWLAVYVVQA